MSHVVFHLHMLMFEQPNYVPEHLALFRLFALLLNVNFSTSFYAYTHELYNLIQDFKNKLWPTNHLHSVT